MKPLVRTNPGRMMKERVAKIKDDLPKNVKQVIATRFPEYDTMEGGVLVNNVLNLRTADVNLTEILEIIAKENREGLIPA